MRIVFLLLVAMLAIKTSAALSQDACSRDYVACMDGCVAKRTGEARCIEACQNKNSTCAANYFSTVQTPTAKVQPANEAADALAAKDLPAAAPSDKAPDAKKAGAPVRK